MVDTTGNEGTYRPTRAPAFTRTMQIGIVVRDLDATLRRYVDDYGIGPWDLFDVTPETAPDLLHDGEPIRASTRAAVTMIVGADPAAGQRGYICPLPGGEG